MADGSDVSGNDQAQPRFSEGKIVVISYDNVML